MATRTDIHCPSKIIPADYDYVGAEYIPRNGQNWHKRVAVIRHMQQHILNHFASTGGAWAEHQHGGTCMSCGAYALYTAVFYHRPSNTYIRTGFDCAAKMHMGDEANFRYVRKQIKHGHEAATGKVRAAKYLHSHGLANAWLIYSRWEANDYYQAQHFSTIIDIVGKLIKYGSLSDKQLNYLADILPHYYASAATNIVLNALDVEDQKPFILAACEDGVVALAVFADWLEGQGDNRCMYLRKAAENALATAVEKAQEKLGQTPKIPCPKVATDVTVQGTVVRCYYKRGEYYGGSWKLIVETTEGYRLWGTCPAALRKDSDLNEGDEVVFTARHITRSYDDDYFGFFRNPVRASVVRRAPVPATA